MRRTCSVGDLIQPVPKIEHYLYMRHRQQQAIVDANHTLKDHTSCNNMEPHSNIVCPVVEENNFELKPFIQSRVQYNQFLVNRQMTQTSIYPFYHVLWYSKNEWNVQRRNLVKTFSLFAKGQARVWLEFLPYDSIMIPL